MNKVIILFGSLFCCCWVDAQSGDCSLSKSAHSDFYTVDVEQTRCLARSSDKDITVFYTYADWCSFCKKSLPDVVKLSEEYDTDLYLLLVDRENDTFYSIDRTAAMLDTVYRHSLKAVIISDSLYTAKALKKLDAPIRKIIDVGGKTSREKYYRFLMEINPENAEENKMTGMGKLIVLNRRGELLGVAYRDYDNIDSPHKGYDEVVTFIKQK